MTAALIPIPTPTLQWDIFCQVIDNFGDIGVCWRLACDLAQRGQCVRLWIDDTSALQWMAPHGCAGVQVWPWGSTLPAHAAPTDVLIEAFGCEITPETIAICAHQASVRGQKPVWINLEYLSAERYVERCHALPSPVQHGPAAGWIKWFFYPGFTPATGGVLREPDLQTRQTRFDIAAWRNAHQAGTGVNPTSGERWISLFCYEPPALAQLLAQCAHASAPTQLLVTPGRAAAAVRSAWDGIEHEIEYKNGLKPLLDVRSQLSFSYLEPCTQSAFDELLWACDLNLVRGEDSLVRALWAGKPLVWHIYPQHDNAHHAKLHAFLDWLQAPPSLRQFHAVWNGISTARLPVLDQDTLRAWGDCVRRARAQLWTQNDLLTQLLGFCLGKR
ncbi:elongation factor P maturation arginine rhamnosyltransferase EarP [Simplicispira psychrophila]|uniref:elongation factor P maturation arginine rhamnosyltransferase EarP n=1 Tax=Simplicispira psychrophila TaxID=80882 RepID=UPI00048248C6|nr:elongation factor P maturation arginine rhamnosyltransferase EarP [Simplicispira psychrophila]